MTYGLDGREQELGRQAGYRGSAPARIGSAAARLATGRGLPAGPDHWRDSLETWPAEQGRQHE